MQSYKTNGFSLPLPWQQVLTWLFYIGDNTLFFVFTLPLLSLALKVVTIVVFGVFSITILVLSLVSTCINPADELFMAEMKKKDDAKKEKRAYWLEISKNQSFCIICCSNISSQSKHCKKCNKCVEHFDHHCNWLNNCIGRANYGYFYCLLLVSVVHLYYGTAVCLYGFITCIQWYTSSERVDSASHSLVSVIITIALAVGDVVLGVNLTYLLAIHTWLRYKGLTTYEYILMKVESKESEAKSNGHKEKMANKSEDNPLNKHQSPIHNNFLNGIDLNNSSIKKKKNKNKFTVNELIKVLDDLPKDMECMKNEQEIIIIEDENAKENIFKPIVDKIYLNKQGSDCQKSIKNAKTNLD